VLCAGAIPVPLYPPLRLGKLDEFNSRTTGMLKAVNAAMVITDERIRRFLGVAVANSAPALGCVTASSLGGPTAESVDVAADDIAVIQFSSGTTNDPKPVALTHANLLANLASLEQYITADGAPYPVGVTWLPLYHDMGLIGNLLSAFYVPGKLVLLPPELFVAMPGAWLRAISRHQGTITAAPSFAFGLCLKRISDEELEGVDLSSWRVCLNGAEAVSPEAQRRFIERFGHWGFPASSFTPCYGMAEASLAVTFKPADTSFKTLGVDGDKLSVNGIVEPGDKEITSVGRPLAGMGVEIRDDHGVVLPSGRVGHIFVSGPSIMAGYFNRPDLTDQALHDGWLHTGDRGFIHDGELFVCGRHKDVVIVRGANHAPEEFEAALDGLVGVRTGCAVAVGFVPAAGEDEALAMLVEQTSDAPPSLAQDVASRVQQHTGILPAHVELLTPGTLPRTSSGKLRRREALTQWQTGQLAPPKKVTAARLLVQAANGEILQARAALARRSKITRSAG
jgi:fatty-acyl-CoA synthase